MPVNVLFRTDASLQIGAGHVVRSLTLADALRERGAECRFACRAHAGNMIEAIRQRGYLAYALPMPEPGAARPPDDVPAPSGHAAWLGTDWESDAAQTMAGAASHAVDWLVVDHYALDARWERKVRSHAARVMVIDDLADRAHDCDALLDQNLGHGPADYQALVPAGCELLIGPSNALLRPQFANRRASSLARRTRARLRHLLVSMGGVDKDNLTSRALESLRDSKLPADCRITVVMGAQAPGLQGVREQAAAMPWTTDVRVDVQDMAALMADSDLAIGAAGGTAWERCCLGLPSLMVVAAANQREIAAALESAGAALNLGEAIPGDFERVAAAAVDRLVDEPAALLAMSERARAVTSGDGAPHVAGRMLSIHSP